MFDRKTPEAIVLIMMACIAGLTVGHVLRPYAPLGWPEILLCAPVVWGLGVLHDRGVHPVWDSMTAGTGILYGAYGFAIMRNRRVGTICVVAFHGLFVVAFAAVGLLFGPGR